MSAIFKHIWAVRRAVFLYGMLLVGGWFLGDAVRKYAIPELSQMSGTTLHIIVMISLFIYVLTTAIPFVPGAEIGFALLMIFGAKVAGIVYLGMVSALVLAFVIARVVPLAVLTRGLNWLGLKRAARLVDEIRALPAQQRPQLLADRLPKSFGPKLMKTRYLLLAIAINTPGNTVIGGGGGLAFMAGVSGLYGFWQYLAVVLCAVAPVPLLFLLT